MKTLCFTKPATMTQESFDTIIGYLKTVKTYRIVDITSEKVELCLRWSIFKNVNKEYAEFGRTLSDIVHCYWSIKI